MREGQFTPAAHVDLVDRKSTWFMRDSRHRPPERAKSCRLVTVVRMIFTARYYYNVTALFVYNMTGKTVNILKTV